MVIVTMIHRSDLVIKSKATALEFYKGVKKCILIPYTEDKVIRIEPDNFFSVVPIECVTDGSAAFIPSVYDDGGIRAFRYRKYINAYLRKDDE